jgi:hypothetical protein
VLFRAVVTRYDKREQIYQGTVDVASVPDLAPGPRSMIREK